MCVCVCMPVLCVCLRKMKEIKRACVYACVSVCACAEQYLIVKKFVCLNNFLHDLNLREITLS